MCDDRIVALASCRGKAQTDKRYRIVKRKLSIYHVNTRTCIKKAAGVKKGRPVGRPFSGERGAFGSSVLPDGEIAADGGEGEHEQGEGEKAGLHIHKASPHALAKAAGVEEGSGEVPRPGP